MKNRFSTFGSHVLRALCMMALCGTAWSCKDEYTLDDEKPDWLYENIYSYLERKGTFTNYLTLLGDKDINTEGARDLKEVLSQTGSKTVFVADDEAWNQFFRHNATLPVTNPWHNATSYQNLSPAQKNLLIHTSMLNNAIVMENLSAADGNGTSAPEPGQYMRRYTDVSVLDTITYLPADQVPHSYSPVDEDYWKDFRGTEDKPGNGIYLVTDATRNMMLHFTREHMGRGDIQITDEDFEIFAGQTREPYDVHIYNSRLVEKDSVAENGYVNLTEKVLVPLPSMAEVIRTSGRTYIFNHLLDRFSYPSPNTELTENYGRLHNEFIGNTAYTKKYFAQLGPNGAQRVDPNGTTVADGMLLQFDPGWNEFSLSSEARTDMATMFVPNDETMIRYFSIGGSGSQLVETYSPNHQAQTFDINDLEALYQQIDYIPLQTLNKLINVIMFPSFVGAVPSKIQTLRDYESQEEMFTPDDIAEIDTCFLASNGAVYVMNKVYGPASYESVVGPANISETNLIMQWAVNNGSDPNQDKMHMNYYAYLMAMRSRFSFFLPSDEALLRYYDPISFTSQHPRVIQIELKYDRNGKPTGNPPLKDGRILHEYDVTEGTIKETAFNLDQLSMNPLVSRLRNILESHTIVHNDLNPIDNEDEYYLAKNGMGLKVTKEFDPATGKYNVVKVQGGFQIENERAGMVEAEDGGTGARGTVHIDIEPKNAQEKLNGHTFILDDSPIIPASRSIYYILDKEFPEEGMLFYSLTDMEGNADIIKDCGLDASNLAIWNTKGAIDRNVSFLSNYNYTVLVPTPDALEAAHAAGLPYWDDIREAYENGLVYAENEEGELEVQHWGGSANGPVMWKHRIDSETGEPEVESTDSTQVTAMITYLNNFIRCHFLDNSFFEDKTARAEEEYTTSSYDNVNGVFVKVYMGRNPSQLYVRDAVNGTRLSTTGNLRNIMTNDMYCIKDTEGNMSGSASSPTGQPTMNNIVLKSSSAAVIHQIDGVLCHTKLQNGRHDSQWADAKAAKNYLKRFSIPATSSIKKMKRHE
ncbi:MAG: hypothetical protein IJ700_00885 [Bacteroidaceae bacterium]|nr:hypothetical protein [Bacteroidaceae bacterium]